MKIQRNSECYCNSGVKYKSCHYMIEAGYVKVGNRWEKGIKISKPVSYNLGSSIGGK